MPSLVYDYYPYFCTEKYIITYPIIVILLHLLYTHLLPSFSCSPCYVQENSDFISYKEVKYTRFRVKALDKYCAHRRTRQSPPLIEKISASPLFDINEVRGMLSYRYLISEHITPHSWHLEQIAKLRCNSYAT